jgi:PAS domain S-box-containing protein
MPEPGSQDNLQLLFDSIADYALLLLDAAGNIIVWNIGAERMFGYRAHEVTNKFYGLLYTDDEKSTNKPGIALEEAVNTGRHESEGWRVSKKQVNFYVHQVTTGIYGKQGDLTGYSIAVRDLTRQKEIEESLNAAISKQEEFIGVASHELKTPLTSINAYFELLSFYLPVEGRAEKVNEILTKTRKQLDRLGNLIRDLLDASKIQSGKVQYQLLEADLDEVVAESISNAAHLYPSHQIILKGQCHCTVKCDSERLEQVFNNLFSNAVKYSPKSNKINVEIAVIKNEVKVSVTDYGIGIARDKQARLFQRFYRADNIGHNFQGLGLGLYITAEIIKRHLGTIWVRSEPGKGSTFSFTLPLHRRKNH